MLKYVNLFVNSIIIFEIFFYSTEQIRYSKEDSLLTPAAFVQYGTSKHVQNLLRLLERIQKDGGPPKDGITKYQVKTVNFDNDYYLYM